MRHPVMVTMGVLLAAAAGAGATDRPLDPPRAPSPVGVMRQAAAVDTLLLAQGKQIVSTLCSACHTEQPPPRTAPPLSHVARRYRMMAGDGDAALARMTAWIAAPSKDRSLMPAMAIDRFGLMAPLPIPEDQRRAAAAYVLSLADAAQGMGHGHGARAARDTTR